MDTGATSSAGSISEMISLVRIANANIIGGRQLMIEISLRHKVGWIGVSFLIIVNGPPVEHDDRVFGYEVALIPIVFNNCVIHAEFIDRSPSQQLCD